GCAVAEAIRRRTTARASATDSGEGTALGSARASVAPDNESLAFGVLPGPVGVQLRGAGRADGRGEHDVDARRVGRGRDRGRQVEGGGAPRRATVDGPSDGALDGSELGRAELVALGVDAGS